MKTLARTSLAILAVTMLSTSHAFAAVIPEIDPSMGAGALALLAGAIVVIRGRSR